MVSSVPEPKSRPKMNVRITCKCRGCGVVLLVHRGWLRSIESLYWEAPHRCPECGRATYKPTAEDVSVTKRDETDF